MFTELLETVAFRGFEAVDFEASVVGNGAAAGTLTPVASSAGQSSQLRPVSILRVVRDAIRGWTTGQRFVAYILLTLPFAVLGGLVLGRVSSHQWRLDWASVTFFELLALVVWPLGHWKWLSK